MRVALSALLAASVLASNAAVDKAKLRELVTLPRPSIGFGFTFSKGGGFMLMWDRAGLEHEIDAERKVLKGEASDADRYLRLGELYSELGKQTSSDDAYAKAAHLYRELLKKRPDDPGILARLGMALDQSSNYEEAEKLLRRAAGLSAKEWRAWASLGDILTAKAMSTISGLTGADLKDASKLMVALSTKPTAEKQAQHDKVKAEAQACFDKAVEVAPQEPQVYAARAAFYTTEGMLALMRQGPTANADSAFDVMLPKEARADISQGAKVAKNDYRAIGTAAMLPVFLDMMRQRDKHPDPLTAASWAAYSDTTKAAVRDAIERLKRISEQEGPSTSGICEVMGTLYAISADPANADAVLKRAVALDPGRDQAWMMRGYLASKRDKAEAAAIFSERLKQSDSALFRFCRASMEARLGKLDESERDIDAALALAPEDFAAGVSKAVLLMKRNADDSAWKQAKSLLEAVQKRSTQLSQDQNADMSFAYGVCQALLGDIQDAKAWLSIARANDDMSDEIKLAILIVNKE